MVVYKVRGQIVEVTGSGQYASAEWDAVFDAVRNDAAVPDNSLFAIDNRKLEMEMSSVQMIDRVRNLRERLGSKLGEKCALVMSAQSAFTSRQFQYFADSVIHLRVGIFTDPAEADRWLLAWVGEM